MPVSPALPARRFLTALGCVVSLGLALLAPSSLRAQPVHPRLFFGPDDVPALRARLATEPYASIHAQIVRSLLSVDYPLRGGNMAFPYLLTQDESFARMAGLRALDYISNLDRWENDNNFGLRRGIDITAVMLMLDFCYHSPYWRDTLVPASVSPESFVINGVTVFVPGTGAGTDSTGKWHTSYTGRTVTVPSKYVGLPLRNAISLALKLNADSNIRSGGSGWPGNDKTGNNWWAVRYGSALLAYLISNEPGLIGSTNYNTAITRLKTHLSANLSDSPLGMGWNPEGVSYAQYPGWATYPAAFALKRLTGRDLVAEHPAMRYALWSTYLGALPWERKSRLGHPVSGTGLGVKPDFDDDHNVWEGEGTAALAFAFAFNDNPADSIPDFDYRSGIKYLFNRLTGQKGDRLWDSSSGNGLYAYLFYPPDTGPGAIPEQNPDSVWGRVYTDPSYGEFIFRSGYQDADFSYGATGQPGYKTPSTDIVTQTTIKLRSEFGGHGGPDGQSLRLYGLGTAWATGSGRAWIVPAQTSLMPYDPTTMGTGTLGVTPFGNEVVDSFLRKNAGDGYVITRQSTSDTGCTNHTRRLIVDYSGQAGAPAFILTYDTAEDTTAFWRWNTFINNTVDTSTPGQFVITAPDGSRLLGKILHPASVQARTGTINRGNEFYFGGSQTVQNRWVDFPLLADGHALVALALVPSGQPLPTIQATGSPASGFTVTSGTASFQINAATNSILSPNWNPPSVAFTSPADGAAFFPAPASVSVSGTASDNALVQRLDFYVDDVLRHTLTPNAQSVSWGPVILNNLALGDRSLKVIATDNVGDTRTATRVVRITNSQPPAVTLTSPAASSQLFGGQTVTLAGRATDAENQLNRVEVWFKNADKDDTKLGNAVLNTAQGTWSYAWSNLPVGVHTVWAVAFDTAGDQTSSASTTLSGSLLFSAVPKWGDAANYTAPVTFDTDNRWTVLPEDGDLRLRIREMKNYDYSAHLSTLIGSNNRNHTNFRFTYRAKVSDPVAQNPSYFTTFGTGDTGPVVFDAQAINSVAPANSWSPAGKGTRVWYYGNSGYRPEIAYTYGLHLTSDSGYPNNPGTLYAGIPHNSWFRITLERVGSRLRVWRDAEDGGGNLLLLDATHNYFGTRGPVGLSNERTAGAKVFFDDIDFQFLDAAGNPLANTDSALAFTAPTAFADLPAGQPVTLTGTASDPEGITSLELFAGATRLGTPAYDSGSGTWSFNWSPLHGDYSLVLSATDTAGFTTTSPARFIRVTTTGGPGGNAPPSVTIAHDTATTGSFRVSGTASDSDGFIAAVQVFVNGSLTGTATLTGGTWSHTLANLPPGNHSVVARAFDAIGSSTDSSPLAITITAPSVALTTNAPQATVGLPTTLRASASDADGLLGVRFFANGVDLGAATLIDGEWRLSWTPAFYRPYALTAVATDRYGVTSTSSATTLTVVPDSGPNGSLLTYLGGPGTQSLLDVHELSDGTLLLAGTASNLTWTSAPKTQLIVPPELASANTGQTAFLLHLSADAQTILGVFHLPAGHVNNLRWIKATNKLGQPTGALFVSGKSTNANDGAYFIARLDNNFVNGNPTRLLWVRQARMSSTYGENSGLQTWDVGADGRIVFADESGALRVFVADADNQLVKLPDLRGSHFATAPYTDANRIAALGTDPAAATASVSAVSFPGDLRSWTEEDRLAVLPDGNGSLKRGRWPYDLFTPVQDKNGAITGTIEYGYTGYKSTGKLRLGGITVDRDTGDFYLGFNVQSAFWDAPANKQQPDFEPAVLAFTATGRQKWWSRLYHEVIDANANGQIDSGETRLSSPDQYVDGLALDYSVPGDTRLVVNARCHGNNTSNLWSGNALAANPGGNGFQNAFTGTEGNIHLSWLGKLRASDGTALRASWLSGYFRNTALTQSAYSEPIHDGWPSHNQGWNNLTTTRAEPGSLRVDAQGRVYIVGAGPRMVTTFNAHQKLPKITGTLNEGIAPWNAFLRVYDPELATLVYSTALTGVWTYPTPGGDPVGANNTELRAVFPTTGGALAVGHHVASSALAQGNPLPVSKVPSWGLSTPNDQTAFFGKLSFTTSANIPPSVSLAQPTGAVSLRPGNSLDLLAQATDADGTLASVAFYANGTLIHTATAAPYAFAWMPAGAEGTLYTVQALATDDAGATTASASATVRMELAPTVALTAPAASAVLQSGQPFTLTASASDVAPGFVTKVEFYTNNVKIGEDSTAPYNFTWTPSALGSSSLQARATDNSGTIGLSPLVTVTVTNANTPPTATFTSPASGSTATEAVYLPLVVEATDSGSVVSVELFRGTTSLGFATAGTNNLWTFLWPPDRRGTVTFTARATDDQGATTTTAPVTVGILADGPPAAPASLAATALSWRRAALTWADLSSNETHFELQRAPAGTGSFTALAIVSAATTTYTDATGSSGATFDYRLRAVNLKGDSAWITTSAPLTFPAQNPQTFHWLGTPASTVWNTADLNWNTAANGSGSTLAWSSSDNSIADLNNRTTAFTLSGSILAHRIQNLRTTLGSGSTPALQLGAGGLSLAASGGLSVPTTLTTSQSWTNTAQDINFTGSGPFTAAAYVTLTWQPVNNRGSFTSGGTSTWADFQGRVIFQGSSTGTMKVEYSSPLSSPGIWDLRGTSSFFNQRADYTVAAVAGTGRIRPDLANRSLFLNTPAAVAETFSGPVETSGGFAVSLVKNGPGRQTFSGTITHAATGGAITVNAGSLWLNGTRTATSVSGPVTVNAASTLGGSGTVEGRLLVNPAGRLAPGSAPAAIGTFTVSGDLSLSAGSALDIDLSADAPQPADRLAFASGSSVTLPAVGSITLRLTQLGRAPLATERFLLVDLTHTSLLGFRSDVFTLDLSATSLFGGQIVRDSTGLWLTNLRATPSGVELIQPEAETVVPEADPTQPGTFYLRLTTAPTSSVTLTLTGDSQVSVSPATLTFTPQNWSLPQTAEAFATPDAAPEGATSQGRHSGSITLASSSADPAYHLLPLSSVPVTVIDDEFNTAPAVSLAAPARADVYLPVPGTRLLLSADALDQGVLNPAWLTWSWSLISGPEGGVTFDATSSRTTRATFTLAGVYQLRVTASDGTFTSSTDAYAYVGAAHIPTAGPTDSLGLRLPLDTSTVTNPSATEGNPFATTPDTSGSALTAQLIKGNGNPRITPDAGRTAQSGDGAFALDAVNYGNGGFLQISDHANLDGTATLTFSFWWRANTLQPSSALFRRDGAYGVFTGDTSATAGRLTFSLAGNTNNDDQAFKTIFTPGRWYHLAVVYDGTQPEAQRLRGYVDGRLDFIGTESAASLGNLSSALVLGRNTGNRFDSRLDDFRLYRRVLSAIEVGQLYSGINRAPLVNAGPDTAASTTAPLTLAGSVTASGPAPALVWSLVSGPGLVHFAAPASATSTASFSQPGTYVLRLAATDPAGGATIVDELTVTVTGAPRPILSLTSENGSITTDPAQTVFANTTTTVTLTATPAPGFRFSHWSGNLTGSANPASLLMDADKSVAAVFVPETYALQLNAQNGTVIATPARPAYSPGEVVTLIPYPADGYYFAGWEGDLSGAADHASLTLSATRTVTARFLPYRTITVTSANGDISYTPYKTRYRQDETVSLRATPRPGYQFVEWTGDLESTTNPIALALDRDWVLSAEYLTDLQVWNVQHFGPTASESLIDPTADPDGDGVPNLLAYALDGNPLTPGSTPLPELEIVHPTLSLVFRRVRAELVYTVEASTDLATWTVIATNPGELGEEVIVVDPATATQSLPRRFLRLRVSTP